MISVYRNLECNCGHAGKGHFFVQAAQSYTCGSRKCHCVDFRAKDPAVIADTYIESRQQASGRLNMNVSKETTTKEAQALANQQGECVFLTFVESAHTEGHYDYTMDASGLLPGEYVVETVSPQGTGDSRKHATCEQLVTEKANVLLVGDRVNLFADQPGAAFGWGTVVCVTEDEVEVVRPFVHTADFTMGAGKGQIGERLMSYMGQETTKLPRRSERTYSVVFRSSVPR